MIFMQVNSCVKNYSKSFFIIVLYFFSFSLHSSGIISILPKTSHTTFAIHHFVQILHSKCSGLISEHAYAPGHNCLINNK